MSHIRLESTNTFKISSLAAGQSVVEEEECVLEGEPSNWYKEEVQEERKTPFVFGFHSTLDVRGNISLLVSFNHFYSNTFD